MINEKTNASATTSSCTYRTEYFNEPVFNYNYIEKSGQVVHVVFLAQVSAAIPNGTAILSGLPTALNPNFRTIYFWSNNMYMDTPYFGTGGTLFNQSGYAVVSTYTISSSYVGKYLYLNFTYISAK